jgi:hypothetical protein
MRLAPLIVDVRPHESDIVFRIARYLRRGTIFHAIEVTSILDLVRCYLCNASYGFVWLWSKRIVISKSIVCFSLWHRLLNSCAMANCGNSVSTFALPAWTRIRFDIATICVGWFIVWKLFSGSGAGVLIQMRPNLTFERDLGPRWRGPRGPSTQR